MGIIQTFIIFVEKYEYMKNLLNYLEEIAELYNNVAEFRKGGKIHIKKKNRGSFTKYCNGNVTEECIRRGKNSPDPKIRKKATFAANARKWRKK